MKKIIFILAITVLISCNKSELDLPDTSGKKCWDCEVTVKYPDTTIIKKDLNCNLTEAEIRNLEKYQSVNNSTVICKEKK